MSIPGTLIPLFNSGPVGTASTYQISRSLRFNSSDSAYLSRTPAVAGNRRTFTFSCWVKRAGLGQDQQLIYAAPSSTDTSHIRFDDDNTLHVFEYTTGFVWQVKTTQVFRDASSWYHILVAVDTTQATPSNRVKIYVNGAEVTAFSASSYPTQNTDTEFNNTVAHAIGRNNAGASNYLSAYLADLHFIDGAALTPSSFTETDATTGQLVPKTYTGSYNVGAGAVNGFKLTFSDNSNNTAATLGADTSGNGNNWTPSPTLQTATGGPTSVAAASGALPIYNTTDTYGTTKGTGTRTDTNSASVKMAVAMDGSNNGTAFTEESATIRGSGSSLSVTRNGNVVTSTAQSKFYGSSGYFPGGGNTDCLTIGSGTSISGADDFTIEYWYYQTGQPVAIGTVIRQSGSGSSDIGIIHWGGSYSFYPLTANTGIATVNNQWTHVAYSRQSGTLRLFVNGILRWTSASNTTTVLNSSNSFFIGSSGPSYPLAEYFQGYLSDVRIYGGVAKYTSNFNPPSSTQNATIAAGSDSLVDTPTNYGTDTGAGGEVRGNYCTLNPLNISGPTLANGNLETTTPSAGYGLTYGTIGVSSGKWYWEITPTANAGGAEIGIAKAGATLTSAVGAYISGYSYVSSALKGNNNSYTSYGVSYTANDVIGVAWNADAGNLTFYKNGESQGTAFSSLSGEFFPVVSDSSNSNGSTFVANFGQRPFAYTAPSGFKALCTQNLTDSLGAQPSTVMNIITYTGNGTSLTLPNANSTPTSISFSPDWVWIKGRSGASDHGLYDTVRGTTKRLVSNATQEEDTQSGVTAFNSDGFSLGSYGGQNGSSATYVAWLWDAGGEPTTNNVAGAGNVPTAGSAKVNGANMTTALAGSIAATRLSVNTSAGFSIVSWNSTTTTPHTFGHGLGVAPQFVIVKRRGGANHWRIGHNSLGWTKALEFSAGAELAADSAYWNNTAPTSTVIYIGDTGQLGGDNIAYCFAPVAGYSSFGSYTGNGSADGPFVFTGFRPKFVLIKALYSYDGGGTTVNSSSWYMYDSVRGPYNANGAILGANKAYTEENNATDIDFLSNGFKLRNTRAINYTETIYAAWAESPFKYARAR